MTFWLGLVGLLVWLGCFMRQAQSSAVLWFEHERRWLGVLHFTSYCLLQLAFARDLFFWTFSSDMLEHTDRWFMCYYRPRCIWENAPLDMIFLVYAYLVAHAFRVSMRETRIWLVVSCLAVVVSLVSESVLFWSRRAWQALDVASSAVVSLYILRSGLVLWRDFRGLRHRWRAEKRQEGYAATAWCLLAVAHALDVVRRVASYGHESRYYLERDNVWWSSLGTAILLVVTTLAGAFACGIRGRFVQHFLPAVDLRARGGADCLDPDQLEALQLLATASSRAGILEEPHDHESLASLRPSQRRRRKKGYTTLLTGDEDELAPEDELAEVDGDGKVSARRSTLVVVDRRDWLATVTRVLEVSVVHTLFLLQLQNTLRLGEGDRLRRWEEQCAACLHPRAPLTKAFSEVDVRQSARRAQLIRITSSSQLLRPPAPRGLTMTMVFTQYFGQFVRARLKGYTASTIYDTSPLFAPLSHARIAPTRTSAFEILLFLALVEGGPERIVSITSSDQQVLGYWRRVLAQLRNVCIQWLEAALLRPNESFAPHYEAMRQALALLQPEDAAALFLDARVCLKYACLELRADERRRPTVPFEGVLSETLWLELHAPTLPELQTQVCSAQKRVFLRLTRTGEECGGGDDAPKKDLYYHAGSYLFMSWNDVRSTIPPVPDTSLGDRAATLQELLVLTEEADEDETQRLLRFALQGPAAPTWAGLWVNGRSVPPLFMWATRSWWPVTNAFSPHEPSRTLHAKHQAWLGGLRNLLAALLFVTYHPRLPKAWKATCLQFWLTFHPLLEPARRAMRQIIETQHKNVHSRLKFTGVLGAKTSNHLLLYDQQLWTQNFRVLQWDVSGTLIHGRFPSRFRLSPSTLRLLEETNLGWEVHGYGGGPPRTQESHAFVEQHLGLVDLEELFVVLVAHVGNYQPPGHAASLCDILLDQWCGDQKTANPGVCTWACWVLHARYISAETNRPLQEVLRWCTQANPGIVPVSPTFPTEQTISAWAQLAQSRRKRIQASITQHTYKFELQARQSSQGLIVHFQEA